MLARETTELGHLGARGLLVSLAFVAVAAIAVSRPLARRWGTARLVAGAAVASVGVIVALTLSARVIDGVREPWADYVPLLGDRRMWRHALRPDADWLLNVALFVPAGATLTLATRRPRTVALALVGLSLAIEGVQHVTHVGLSDPGDVVANSIGALLGVVGAAATLRRRERRGAPSGQREHAGGIAR